MRTIAEIKKSIEVDFMNSELTEAAYAGTDNKNDFKKGEDFSKYFSLVSVESILFHVFACCVWVMERLFGEHKKDVNDVIDSIKPHRPKWYRDKVLNYMDGKALIDGTDKYDTTGMSDQEIENLKIVKYAVANEDPSTSRLIIKIATEKDGKRKEIDEEALSSIRYYVNEIKDAGVKVKVESEPAEFFTCSFDIYYNPLVPEDEIVKTCSDAVSSYVENLPFNGEYSNMALTDCLQQVDGVRVVEFLGASVSAREDFSSSVTINNPYIPISGYMKIKDIKINPIPHEQ